MPHDLIPISEITRATRIDDMNAAIREWHTTTGRERAYRRGIALACIAEVRTLYLVPDRRAFWAAVERSRARALVAQAQDALVMLVAAE